MSKQERIAKIEKQNRRFGGCAKIIRTGARLSFKSAGLTRKR
jgi:ribosomal protein L39E